MDPVIEEDADKHDEGIRTLVNAIAMLLASAPDEYDFWAAFYKFARENHHRVMSEATYKGMNEAYKRDRDARIAKAAETLNSLGDEGPKHINIKEFIKAAMSDERRNSKK